MSDQSSTQSFVAAQSLHSLFAWLFDTSRRRLFATLFVIAIVLGITTEFFSIYQNWQQIRINTYQIEIKSAESCVTRITALGKLMSGAALSTGKKAPGEKQIYEECSFYMTPD